MTDTPIDPTDLAASGDDELVFDDIAPAAAPRKSRRTPAKGRDAAAGADAPAADLPPSAAPARDVAEEPADPPAPVPQPGDASAGSAPPGAAPRDRSRMILLAIVGLALFTSLMSLGGLIAVSRTLAAAQAQRAQASGERAELARLPELIAALDRTNAGLAAASARGGPAAPPVGTTTPLTAEDLRHSLDDLRLALDNHQPAGSAAIGDTLHSGFAEIGVRLDRIDAQLARPAAARTAAPR